ncbi:hypothetical protein [Alkalimonas mucilaginosa]|uniref:Uncharacterized protein n=1 Tax=Alkalimonas mucilaginosa TaxID=3057676 RepID=A0ABU7JBQ4_9GAMM|nr:hypothetical protein [Alkalimonas sp. MEB004]MEE2023128.1 hypothetical protein [Alkalimonas sp. MEB004]
MTSSTIILKIQELIEPYACIYRVESSYGFAEIIPLVDGLDCSYIEFLAAAKSIDAHQAQTLLSAILHQTLAYHAVIMPIEQARSLAHEFLSSLDEPVKFYSNCFCDDDVSGVGSWNPVTDSTFEALLYCETTNNSILFFAVDED